MAYVGLGSDPRLADKLFLYIDFGNDINFYKAFLMKTGTKE